MEKNALLKEITAAVRRGSVTHEDVVEAADAGLTKKNGSRDASLVLPHRHLNMAEVLSALGGGIVFLGIVILVAQNWDDLSSATRILATLGGALVAYVTGALFGSRKESRWQMVSQAFFLIFGLVLPVGIAVAFHEAGYEVGRSGMQAMMAVMLLAVHIASFFVYDKQLFAFFAISSGVWFIYAFVAWILRDQSGVDIAKVMEYLTLGVGAGGVLLGYGWRNTRLKGLTSLLYLAGLMGFLGAAIALGGYAPDQNVFWELAMPALALWVVFLSTTLKSREFLAVGSLYLMITILKTTSEYFSDSFGWPLALVFAGLGLIAVGAFTWRVKERI